MKTYNQTKSYPSTRLKVNKTTEGMTIEQKIERILSNKERPKDGAPMIYTERKEGVKPAYNIKTDRWEVAVDATTAVEKSYKARREERNKPKTEGDPGPKEQSGEKQPKTDKSA